MMTVRCSGRTSARIPGAPVLNINGPSASGVLRSTLNDTLGVRNIKKNDLLCSKIPKSPQGIHYTLDESENCHFGKEYVNTSIR